MKSSIITGLNFNSSVQFMSINSATDLTVSKLTMDNSAGDSLGHNTAAFDVESSTGGESYFTLDFKTCIKTLC
jgi:polygalacturonase